MNKPLPARATARIAPYMDALKAGHAAGWTWKELKERLPDDLKLSETQIAQAVMRCKYSVPQLPLSGMNQKAPQHPQAQEQDKPTDGAPSGLSYADRLAQAKANKVNTESLFVTSK